MHKHEKPPFSRHRRVENELLFKQENTRIKEVVESASGRPNVLPIPFYCECADLNCSEIINLTGEEFETYHAHPDWYTVKKGHVQNDIETIVDTEDHFDVVKKFESVTA